jgi:hypothetical protein
VKERLRWSWWWRGLVERVPRCMLDSLVAHTKDNRSCRRGDVIGRPEGPCSLSLLLGSIECFNKYWRRRGCHAAMLRSRLPNSSHVRNEQARIKARSHRFFTNSLQPQACLLTSARSRLPAPPDVRRTLARKPSPIRSPPSSTCTLVLNFTTSLYTHIHSRWHPARFLPT